VAEYIPVAPPSSIEVPEDAPEETSPQAGTKRKVLDQSQVSGEIFDEDILSDIERRLDAEPEAKGLKPSTEKVELDKADLPVLDALIPPPSIQEPPPEVEVDLAGEETVLPEMEGEGEEAPKGRKNLFLLIGGVSFLALAAGVTLWFTLLMPSRKVITAPPPQAVVGDKIPDPQLALRLELDPFLVPLVAAEKGRLLKVGVSLEVSDPADKDLLLPYKLQMRDAIYRMLRDRPAEEVQGARTKNLLQGQIKTELNHLLGSVIIYQVYFTDFVITG
jgi:flagellar basal body-associated protein FliL